MSEYFHLEKTAMELLTTDELKVTRNLADR